MAGKDGFDLKSDFDPRIHDPWIWLTNNQLIGKKCIVPLIGGGEQIVKAGVDVVSIQTTSAYAMQLCLTIQPPQFLSNAQATAVAQSGDTQNISGDYDNQQPGFPNIIIGNPSVRINWGIGGTFDQVDCDIANGLCVNLDASFLRVTCIVDTLDITDIADDVVYALSAFIGRGVPKALNAQKTVACGAQAAINELSDIFAIPRHSKAATLVGVQASVAGIPGDANRFSGTIQFFRSPAASIDSMISESFFDESTHYPVNVPNGAIFFRVMNLTPTSVGGIIRTNVIFDLSV